MANEIKISDAVYTDEQITSANAFIVRSIDGDELQYDTFSSTLEIGTKTPTKFVPKGSTGMLTADAKLFMCLPYTYILVSDPTKYKYGTETTVTCDGRVLGKFYLSEVNKLSPTRFEIKCISAVGILDNSLHYGGIYPTGATVKDLLDSIIGDVVKFSIDDTQVIDGKIVNISNVKLYGWLPIATRRENLHQVLFAVGATVTSDPVTGDLKIVPLTARTTKKIPSNRVFKEGSIKYPKEVRSISLTEHSYTTGKVGQVTEQELFSGEVVNDPIVSPQTGQLVYGSIIEFDSPMSKLRVSGTTILEQNVNYALLAPSTKCTLYGTPYLHGTRQLTYSTDNTIGIIGEYDEKEKKLSVSEAWLVSLANSEKVAERLLSYYHSAKTVCTDIRVEDENPGDTVSFVDPFEEDTEGIIESMDIVLSHMNRAKTKIISDFTPPIPGNTYTRVETITTNTIWNPPVGVNRVKFVLIGGGQGGSSGNHGHDGKSASGFDPDGDGKGGKGGAGGKGGKIFIISTPVSQSSSFNIKIGQGGIGGVAKTEGSSSGLTGSATTVNAYSSDNGQESDTGFLDIFSGDSYGVPGNSGIDGGGGCPDGGCNTIIYNGKEYKPGTYGKDYSYKHFGDAYGGGGGGAAVGSSGSVGHNAHPNRRWITNNQYEVVGVLGGDGGEGATAIAPQRVTKAGNGGTGGNGGGGGGSGGTVSDRSEHNIPGEGGEGGSGSNGGVAANGIVLIYY